MSPRSVSTVSTHSFPLHHFYFYYLPFICWWKVLYRFPESRLPPSIIMLPINMFLWPPMSPICWSLHINTQLDSYWMYSKNQHRCCVILSVLGGNKCLTVSLFLSVWNEHHWWSLYRFIISLDIAQCWYSQAILS